MPAGKFAFLASLCYGKHVYPETVHTEGITKITLEDVAYAEDWGGVIKLIGRAKKLDKRYAGCHGQPGIYSARQSACQH